MRYLNSILLRRLLSHNICTSHQESYYLLVSSRSSTHTNNNGIKTRRRDFSRCATTFSTAVSRGSHTSKSSSERRAQAQLHTVWMSTSEDINTNLALEEWIFKNVDLTNESLLLLWRNKPCVVIGRHQNPWLEVDLSTSARQGVRVARRCSGGGTVYHDLGNMCLTVFTCQSRYDRKYNLELVCQVLRKVWNVQCCVTDRDDILLENKYKISGTAARLAGRKAYHHFTLLLHVDMSSLSQLLSSRMHGIVSNATESVPATVRNLSDINHLITYENLSTAIAEEFISRSPDKKELVRYVDPNMEEEFPGLHSRRLEMTDWDWIYGKTPKFTIHEKVNDSLGRRSLSGEVILVIDKGHIVDFEVKLDGHHFSNIFRSVGEMLRNVRFTHGDIDLAMEELCDMCNDNTESEIYWIWQVLVDMFK